MPSYAIKSSGIRQVAANTLIGNSTGSTGSAEELSANDAKTLLGLGSSDSPTFAGLTIDEDSSYSIGVSKIAYKSGGGGTKARISVSNVTELELTGSKLAVGSGHSIGFASTSYADSGFLDTVLYRDGAGVIAQRNGTNAQSFRIYNTDDGSQTNYERLKVGWSGNDAIIGTERAGTGSTRTLQFQLAGSNRLEITGTWIDLEHCRPFTDGTKYFGYSTNRWKVGYWGGNTVTTSTPIFDGTQTWNDAGVEFTGINVDITNTASLSYSKLLDLKVGGSRIFGIDRTGDWQLPDSFSISLRSNSRGKRLDIHINGIRMRNAGALSWTDSTKTDGNEDLFLLRDGAGILAQRNGTNAQNLNVYNTYTDASNYERGVVGWDSNVFSIGTQAAGTGVLRAVEFVGSAFDFDNKTITAGELQLGNTGQCKLDFAGTSLYATGPEGIIFRFESDTTNASIFRFYGNSGDQLTASSGVQSFLDIDADINQSSTAGYTGIDLDVTETATGSGDKNLIDLKVGGTSKFSVTNAGMITTAGGNGSGTAGGLMLGNSIGWISRGTGSVELASGSAEYVEIASDGITLRTGNSFGWSANNNPQDATGPRLWENTTDERIELRRGTTALGFAVANTWTDASNFEFGVFDFTTTANTLTIGTEAAGTGTQRSVKVTGGGYTVIQGASGSELHQGGSRVLRCSGAAYFYKSAEPIGTINLGGSSSRWANVYATNADLSGGVSMPNLPTSDPASAGELWNDSGTLKVSAG